MHFFLHYEYKFPPVALQSRAATGAETVAAGHAFLCYPVCFFLLLLFGMLCACSDNPPAMQDDEQDAKTEQEQTGTAEEKEIILWIDASANLRTFLDKTNVTLYLDKAVRTGFNRIVLDVRPLTGYPMYPSKVLPEITQLHGTAVQRDWDYLGFFLEEAHRRKMKVTASITVFSGGQCGAREGLVYDDTRWNGKSCVEYTPEGMSDIRNNASQVTVFMNPADALVRKLALDLLKEIASRYPVDGIALDYCRYADEKSDFSETSRKAFETYLGKTLDRFPDDIFRYDAEGRRVAGVHYKEWWSFRAMNIYLFIREARETIKAIRPDITLEYWAASWYGALYTKGQNYASQNYDTSLEYPAYADANYRQYGFAGLLDVFQAGAYMEKVMGANDPESMEAQLTNVKRVIQNECKMYGSFYAANQRTSDAASDAVFLCLDRTDGLMVFDIVQVIQFDLWDGIKDGIRRYKIANSE
ncbi:MAG: family 10 glycosylhydrolase [Bacteroidales bacterium]|jgi:uncharacterized lipoprotein YddW (UPF0748 family)|nr:family 10 glycosylhydrolase [Bacteroidales bacterium]